MPDEPIAKPEGEVKAEVKPADNAPPPWLEQLGATIGREAARAAQEAPPAAPPVQGPQLIADVPDEDIAGAYERGDYAAAAKLQRQQRQAFEQRVAYQQEAVLSQGRTALNQLSEQTIANDPEARPYIDEIRAKMGEFMRANPTALVGPEYWATARDIIVGRHTKQIREQEREALVRRLRDSGVPLTPEGTVARGEASNPEDEITGFAEPGSRFDEFWRNKARAHGGRSADEEVRIMAMKLVPQAGDYDEEESRRLGQHVYKRPDYKNGIRDFYEDQKKFKQWVANNPTLGLDK